jgi:hypothetical protein
MIIQPDDLFREKKLMKKKSKYTFLLIKKKMESFLPWSGQLV